MNKKQEANEFVKECITTALLKMLKERDFSDITITDLVKRAGVSRISFYRNYESKEDVLRKHIHLLLKAWGNRYEGVNGTALIEAIFTHYQENSDLYVLLYKRGLSHISLQSLKDVCGPRQKQNNKAAYTSAFISGGLYGWIEEWFQRGMQESPKEMAAMLEASTSPRIEA